MKKSLAQLSSIALLATGISAPAGAALLPAPAGVGPINSAVGYPQWWNDVIGYKPLIR